MRYDDNSQLVISAITILQGPSIYNQLRGICLDKQTGIMYGRVEEGG